MAAKTIFTLCATALFVQAISAACINSGNLGSYAGASAASSARAGSGLTGFNSGMSSSAANANSWSGNSFGFGASAGAASSASSSAGSGFAGLNSGFLGTAGYGYNAASSSGGAFPISSASQIYPSGVSVLSENLIEGPLTVSGQLPFLAAVGLEGEVATSGSGTVNYGAGNGNVGITNEGLSSADAGYASSALAAAGYGSSLARNAGFSGAQFAAGFGPNSGYGYISRPSCGCNRY